MNVTWRRLAGTVAHAVPDAGWGLSLCGRSGLWHPAGDTDSRCEHCQRRLQTLDTNIKPVDKGEPK